MSTRSYLILVFGGGFFGSLADIAGHRLKAMNYGVATFSNVELFVWLALVIFFAVEHVILLFVLVALSEK